MSQDKNEQRKVESGWVQEGAQGRIPQCQNSGNQPKIVPPQGGSGTAPPQGQNKPKK
jgi:hypothetical protein